MSDRTEDGNVTTRCEYEKREREREMIMKGRKGRHGRHDFPECCDSTFLALVNRQKPLPMGVWTSDPCGAATAAAAAAAARTFLGPDHAITVLPNGRVVEAGAQTHTLRRPRTDTQTGAHTQVRVFVCVLLTFSLHSLPCCACRLSEAKTCSLCGQGGWHCGNISVPLPGTFSPETN